MIRYKYTVGFTHFNEITISLNRLDTYILRQFVGPFVLIISVLTVVIWITQSLQRIELIIENGRGIGLFLYLSILIIPSLLVILIPFALFGATLYTLYRMHSDSEIAIMFAAGISRARIALPILLVTCLGAAATLYIALDLSPRTYRLLKEKILEVRTDFASSVLRSGEFIKIIDGFTIYVDEVRPGNQFTGLLVNDYRNSLETRTYMAQRGVLKDNINGPVLILVDGNIQRKSNTTSTVDIIPFSETSISLAALQQKQNLQLELTERYIHELLNPDLSKPWERANQAKMITEAHNRFSSPLHTFAYVLVALFALIGGAYNRHGYLLRIVIASAFVITLRVSSYILLSFANTNGAQWLLYALPFLIMVLTTLLLFDLIPFLRINNHLKAQTNSSDVHHQSGGGV